MPLLSCARPTDSYRISEVVHPATRAHVLAETAGHTNVVCGACATAKRAFVAWHQRHEDASANFASVASSSHTIFLPPHASQQESKI